MHGSRPKVGAAFQWRDPFEDPVLQVVRRHNKQCRRHQAKRFPKKPLSPGPHKGSGCQACPLFVPLKVRSRSDGRQQASFKGRPPRFHNSHDPKIKRRGGVYWYIHGLCYGYLNYVNSKLQLGEVTVGIVKYFLSRVRGLAFETLTSHKGLSKTLFAQCTVLKRYLSKTSLGNLNGPP